jgi:hypothetical protein
MTARERLQPNQNQRLRASLIRRHSRSGVLRGNCFRVAINLYFCRIGQRRVGVLVDSSFRSIPRFAVCSNLQQRSGRWRWPRRSTRPLPRIWLRCWVFIGSGAGPPKSCHQLSRPPPDHRCINSRKSTSNVGTKGMTVTRDVSLSHGGECGMYWPTDGPTQDGSSGTAEFALSVPTGLRPVHAFCIPSGPGRR